MALRESLQFPELSCEATRCLKELAEQILVRLERGEDANGHIEQVKAITGNADYDETYFRMIADCGSPGEFAAQAAVGQPPLISDLTREEIIEILSLIEDGVPPKQDYYVALLDKNLPNAEVSDLIFWPDRERSHEEIADEALYRVALWRDRGIAAVRAHLVRLADEVRANPASPLWAQQWAKSYRS